MPKMFGLSAEVAKGHFCYQLEDLPKYLEPSHSGLYDGDDGLVPAVEKFSVEHKRPKEARQLKEWWKEMAESHAQSNTPYDVMLLMFVTS